MVACVLCMIIVGLLGMLVGMILESIIENASVEHSAKQEVTEAPSVQDIPEVKYEDCENYFKDF